MEASHLKKGYGFAGATKTNPNNTEEKKRKITVVILSLYIIFFGEKPDKPSHKCTDLPLKSHTD